MDVLWKNQNIFSTSSAMTLSSGSLICGRRLRYKMRISLWIDSMGFNVLQQKRILTGMKLSNHALMISAVSLSDGEGVLLLHCCKASASVCAADKTFECGCCGYPPLSPTKNNNNRMNS